MEENIETPVYSEKTKRQIKWMEKWCKEEGLVLSLDGECGFGRPCVGVLGFGDNAESACYPDYYWYAKDENGYFKDSEDGELINLDKNGIVWTPEDAYHKHECVAVLGHGEESIAQLYKWLKWFEKNNFHYKRVAVKGKFDLIELMLGNNWHHMMEKSNE